MNEEATRIEYLLKLIDDPDEAVWRPVRSLLLEDPSLSLTDLQQFYDQATSELAAYRLDELIFRLGLDQLKNGWFGWWNQPKPGLLDGVSLLSQLVRPEYNKADLIREIQPISKSIWLEMNEKLTALEKIRILEYVFFKKQRFEFSSETQVKSHQLFIPNILKSGMGNPLGIALLFVLISRELGLPVYKTGPNDFPVLAYLNSPQFVEYPESNFSNPQVLFYFSVQEKFEYFGKKLLISNLERIKMEPDRHLRILSDQEFILLILKKLFALYKAEKKERQITKIKEILELLGA